MIAVSSTLALCVPTAALEQDGFVYEVLDDSTLCITGYTGSESVVIIPEDIDGQTVSTVGEYAFAESDGMTIVNIPLSVHTVGEGAFAGCADLRQAEIPQSVYDVPADMFKDCVSLQNVYLPSTLMSIGDGAFAGCSALENIYYGGHDEWYWNGVSVGNNNDELLNATLHYEPYPYMVGDVTRDGQIDMRDAFQVYKWASEGGVPDDMVWLADMTQDGEVDMRDAFSLYLYPYRTGR